MRRPEVGDRLPPRTLRPTLRQLVRYAGASRDFYEMHYDVPFAQAQGYRELSVHGLLKSALLSRYLTDWLDGAGRVTALGVSYRGMDFRDEPMTLQAEVTAVDGDRVELDVWVQSADGTRSTPGTATVDLG